MSYSSGSFSLVSGNPVVTGTVISSTWANNTLSDIATGLSTALLKDGTQTVTANIPMSSHKFTGLSAGSSSGDSVRWEQSPVGVVTTKGDLSPATGSGAIARLAAGVNGTGLVADSSQTTGLNYIPAPIALTGAAGTNTITATAAPAITAYATGQQFVLIPASANTGATTLNVSSVGAKNIFAGNAALVGGELHANIPVTVFYDGTQFQIIGPVAKQPTIQSFTSGTSATYTTPAGVTRIIVECWGPGGGGGAQATNAGGNGSAATTFSTLSAGAGNGGSAGAAAGGAGGTASGGDINISGATGQPGITNSATVGVPGGAGGHAPFIGVAGAGGLASNAGGNAPANSGGGGGGGGGSTSPAPAGAGGGGGAYCKKTITAPAATYTYTVGTGGTGGSAGGTAGGNGAAGFIYVTEFYS